MRIAVDARHLAAGRGVARHSRRLLEALRAGFPEDVHAPVAGGRAAFAAAALTGRPRLDRLAGGPPPDVVWLPAPAPVAISASTPYVVTVHDLSWLERPRDFTAYERLWHRLARVRELVAGAAATICVSEATRAALVERWPLPAGRVHVVRSAPGIAPADGSWAGEPVPMADMPAHDGERRRYFLAVGALEPRKAPDLLVRAFAAARSRGLDAELVLAGSGRLAGRLRGDGVRLAGAVADEELAALYRGAIALVHPAWLEGFGLAPVEAAAFATPSIVADLPVHAETLGAAALRVPPGDEAALADALLALAGDPARRRRLGAQAARSVAALSWERAARETRAVLAQAAGC